MRNKLKSLVTILYMGLFLHSLSAGVTLPHIFSNGNIADANQMNANFNALSNQIDLNTNIGGNVSGGNLVLLETTITPSVEAGKGKVFTDNNASGNLKFLRSDGATFDLVKNELPQTASIGDLLSWNGTKWTAALNNETGMMHTSLGNTLTDYVTVGNLSVRYSSNVLGGYIECKTVSGSHNMQVHCSKRVTGVRLSTASTEQAFHSGGTGYSTTWNPLISLWNDGTAAYSDRVILSTYNYFEATMYDMGITTDPVPNPVCYKVTASIDGYNNVFIKVDYSK